VTRIPDFGGHANYPLGLNERNDVCGTMANKQSAMRGFLFRHGITHDLNTVTFDRHGWIVSSANAINDNGWIAATGYKNQKYAAFVLRPLEKGTIRRVARIASGAVFDGVLSAKVSE